MSMEQQQKHKKTVRLNFEFPLEEYPYLKMVCAMKGVSFRDFATHLLLKAIEDAEDEMLAKKANERLEDMNPEDVISWNEAKKLAGWEQ